MSEKVIHEVYAEIAKKPTHGRPTRCVVNVLVKDPKTDEVNFRDRQFLDMKASFPTVVWKNKNAFYVKFKSGQRISYRRNSAIEQWRKVDEM